MNFKMLSIQLSLFFLRFLINSEITSYKLATIPKSAISNMGAYSFLLIAIITLEVSIPTRC